MCLCAYAPYTTKCTSLVRLIFSSLILSSCSVSCYFVSIPYAVRPLVVVLGGFRLCYILDCCMSSSSSFFCFVCLCLVNRGRCRCCSRRRLRRRYQLLLLLLLLQLLLFTLMRTTDQNETHMKTIKCAHEHTHTHSVKTQHVTHFTLSVDSLSFRGFDILPAGSILRTMAEVAAGGH